MALSEEQKQEFIKIVNRVCSCMRVTKTVCSRSVKFEGGDYYTGFSSAWDTVQDDAGENPDLFSEETSKGMTLRESRLAALLLGMQADIAAHQLAYAGGDLNEESLRAVTEDIKSRYNLLISETLFGAGNV